MPRRHSLLQAELKQTKPFASIYEETWLAVVKTADGLRRATGRRLEARDTTLQQYNVLRILRGAGPRGVATLSIGERLVEDAPGMTRLLDRLEAKGLARRERCEKDRRQVLCHLTAAGAALLAELDPLVDAESDALRARLTAQEAETLVELLEKLRAPVLP